MEGKRGIQEDVTYHKVSLERIRDRATAKEQVRIRYRTAAKESAVTRKNEVKQHGYEDSEKYIEATMRSQCSAQPSRRGETMKRTEKSKANSRQKSIANGRQSKPKDCGPRQGEIRGEVHSTE